MNILFIDTETSGLDPKKHSVLSLSYIIYNVEDDKILTQGTYLIKHDNFVATPEALAINKLDMSSIVKTGISETIMADELNRIINLHDCQFVSGYNVQFDVEFLKDIITLPRRVVDIYSLVVLVEGKSYKLEQICKLYNIQHTPHDSASDISATLELYRFYKRGLRHE